MKAKHTLRIVSLVLAIIMAFSSLMPAFAAEAKSFSDVKTGDWFYDSVMSCASQGIVTGFEDGTFRPNDAVTSVQFIVMMTRTFYSEWIGNVTNIPAGSPWWYQYESVASLMCMLEGLTLSDSPMSRYDMALVLYNTILFEGKDYRAQYDMLESAANSFPDWSDIPVKYQDAVKYCYALGIITGSDGGRFMGKSSMTRAQACTVISRMMAFMGGNTPVAGNNNQDNNYSKPGNDSSNDQETPTLTNGQPITVENVKAMLAEIRAQYPQGTIWAKSDVPNTNYYADGPSVTDNTRDISVLNAQFKGIHGNLVSLQYACGGWAAMVSESIFGKRGLPFREVTDRSKVRPGDVVVCVTSKGEIHHYEVVYNVLQDAGDGRWYFQVCDGNGGGIVNWFDAYSCINTNTRVFTRYPD